MISASPSEAYVAMFVFSKSGRKQERIDTRPSLPNTLIEVRSTSICRVIRLSIGESEADFSRQDSFASATLYWIFSPRNVNPTCAAFPSSISVRYPKAPRKCLQASCPPLLISGTARSALAGGCPRFPVRADETARPLIKSVCPGCPFCPPRFRPCFRRKLRVRGFRRPSLAGGFLLFWLCFANWSSRRW